MRRAFLITGFAVAAVLVLFWALDGFGMLQRWAVDGQREVQAVMASAIRALKAGKPGALAGLLTVCFSYGFLHAAGPGHGKMLIGGYGMGSRVRLMPLAGIAVAASLAQATVAVALVYAGVFLLGWTRDRMVDVSEQVMTPLSYIAVAGIGLWLCFRGWRGLRAGWHETSSHPGDAAHAQHPHDPAYDHADPHHVHDAHCGHAHGPSLDEVARVHGWRDAAALVAGVALRPCTGALFLLILTWQMGIGEMGVLGAYAMGLGTAAVTLVVAGMAVWAREGTLATLPGAGLARSLPMLEIAAGGVIAIVATRLLIGAI